ncbi:MAG: hypothetical protein KY434_05795 [Actinobacteria bacterium]|nr:hypothetical protein [Actinomycetota bacterium]
MLLRLLVVLALIAFAVWVYYEVKAARGRQPLRSLPRPRPRRHQRLPDAEVDAHVRALKHAVDGGVVTMDEAVSSLVRKCGLGESEARRRLRG